MWARRLRLFGLPRPGVVLERPTQHRPHRADLDAHPAAFAVHKLVLRARDETRRPALHHVQRMDPHLLVTDPHAAVAEDAAVVVDHDDFVQDFLGVGLGNRLERALPDVHLEGGVLQFAGTRLVAVGAVQRVMLQQQFHRLLAGLAQGLRVRPHLHAVARRGGAGRAGPGRTRLDFHDAHPAGAGRLQDFVIAQRRDVDPHSGRRVQHARAARHRHLGAVDRQGYGCVSDVRFLRIPPLPIYLSEHDVDAPDARHQVRQQRAFDHLL